MVYPWKPMGLNLKAMDFHGQPLKAKKPWVSIGVLLELKQTMDFHGQIMEIHCVQLERHEFS